MILYEPFVSRQTTISEFVIYLMDAMDFYSDPLAKYMNDAQYGHSMFSSFTLNSKKKIYFVEQYSISVYPVLNHNNIKI